MKGFLGLILDVLARRAKSLSYDSQLVEEVVRMPVAPCVDSDGIQRDTAAKYWPHTTIDSDLRAGENPMTPRGQIQTYRLRQQVAERRRAK
jgi:hypothetical protein